MRDRGTRVSDSLDFGTLVDWALEEGGVGDGLCWSLVRRAANLPCPIGDASAHASSEDRRLRLDGLRGRESAFQHIGLVR
jgi:hypothetical protein